MIVDEDTPIEHLSRLRSKGVNVVVAEAVRAEFLRKLFLRPLSAHLIRNICREVIIRTNGS